jgi:hypothetical protein
MADTRKDPQKTVDLPPTGPRNPDPITDAPGSHPIETGIGAVIGGVASGMAVGTLTAGPLGAVAGAIVGGAAAGGLAGKGVGELIDPTTEDNWIREYFGRKNTRPSEDDLAAQRRAYRYGQAAQARYPGKMFTEVESSLRRGWEDSGEKAAWSTVSDAVRGGFDRTLDHVPRSV